MRGYFDQKDGCCNFDPFVIPGASSLTVTQLKPYEFKKEYPEYGPDWHWKNVTSNP